MIYKVFSIRDKKTEKYDPPQLFSNGMAAMRGYQVTLAQPNMLTKLYPEDFEVYEIGEYDNIKGLMIPHKINHLICGVKDLISKKQAEEEKHALFTQNNSNDKGDSHADNSKKGSRRS